MVRASVLQAAIGMFINIVKMQQDQQQAMQSTIVNLTSQAQNLSQQEANRAALGEVFLPESSAVVSAGNR